MSLFPVTANQVQLSTDAPVGTDSYVNGILTNATNTAARASLTGAAQYSNGLVKTVAGQVVYVDATVALPAGTQFVNGLPLTPAGALCISTGPAVVYQSGLPFVANGAVAAAIASGGANVTWDSATPWDSTTYWN